MESDKKIAIIVQARMKSTRLRGKVMQDISGKPMLWHVVDRLRQIKLKNDIIIATTTEKEDDMIADFCKKNSVNFYRGSEQNVLDRYYQAAKINKADVVVRVTSDCPLIDPEVSGRVISAYLKNSGDFIGASNAIKRSFPRGLDTEAVSFSGLEKCWKMAEEPYHREHVTIYMHEHPELFKIYYVVNDRDLSSLRWTVDEKDDIDFVRQIYKRLYKQGKVFLMNDILKVLEKEPDLALINQHIKQKAVK